METSIANLDGGGNNDQSTLERPVPSYQLLGIHFSTADVEQMSDLIAGHREVDTHARLVVTANVDHVVHLERDPVFRDAYAAADLVTVDGMPVLIYARLRGAKIPSRVTGHDLLGAVLRKVDPRRHRLFFVVNTHETALAVQEWALKTGYLEHGVQTVVPPFGFEQQADYCQELARNVREHQTHILIMGVGSPKSERVIYSYRHLLGPCWGLSVGDAVAVFAGTGQRAPEWIQKLCFEWFWRFLRDPRRLFKRYFWDSRIFLRAIARDLKTVSRKVR